MRQTVLGRRALRISIGSHKISITGVRRYPVRVTAMDTTGQIIRIVMGRRNMKFITFSLLITFPLLLTGCLGLVVGTFGKHEKLTTSFAFVKGRTNLNSNTSAQPGDCSETKIIELWGKPDEVTTNGCCKVLKYRTGISWAGVGAYLIVVPIPLGVPTGHYYDRLYIKDGRCVAIVEEYSEGSRAYGYYMGDVGNSFWFGEVNGPTKVPLDFCK
jgi:hypothetical protein